jgi:hypothetical protein
MRGLSLMQLRRMGSRFLVKERGRGAGEQTYEPPTSRLEAHVVLRSRPAPITYAVRRAFPRAGCGTDAINRFLSPYTERTSDEIALTPSATTTQTKKAPLEVAI